jgi:hypothetical protein
MKTLRKSNFRVEVYPKTTLYGFAVADEEDVCKTMRAEILRHVRGVLLVKIVSDNDPVCASCGRQWTEDGDAYNDGCCKADQDAEDARANGGDAAAAPGAAATEGAR